jgi:hypothetical protein
MIPALALAAVLGIAMADAQPSPVGGPQELGLDPATANM